MNQMKREIIKREEGSSLVLALMVLLVLSTLGSALGVATVGSYKLADVNRDTTSAYYIAEAGANMAYEELKDETIKIYKRPSVTEGKYFTEVSNIVSTLFNNKIYDGFVSTHNGNQNATVEIEGPKNNADGSKEYTIKSTGIVDGRSRSVEKPVTVRWVSKGGNINNLVPSPSEQAVITFFNTLVLQPSNNQFEISQGNVLYRNDSSLLLSNGKKIEEEGYYKDINFNDDLSITLKQYQDAFDAAFPDNNEDYRTNLDIGSKKIVLSGNTKVDSLNLNGIYNLESNDKNVNLIVKDLKFTGDTTLVFNNSNIINIFVTGEFDFGNGNKDIILNKNGDVSNLNIFYSGNNTIDFPGDFTFNGSLLVKKASLYFSNKAYINGMIVSGGDSIQFRNKAELKYVNGFNNGFPFGPGNTDNSEKDSNASDIITSEPAIEQ